MKVIESRGFDVDTVYELPPGIWVGKLESQGCETLFVKTPYLDSVIGIDILDSKTDLSMRTWENEKQRSNKVVNVRPATISEIQILTEPMRVA